MPQNIVDVYEDYSERTAEDFKSILESRGYTASQEFHRHLAGIVLMTAKNNPIESIVNLIYWVRALKRCYAVKLNLWKLVYWIAILFRNKKTTIL